MVSGGSTVAIGVSIGCNTRCVIACSRFNPTEPATAMQSAASSASSRSETPKLSPRPRSETSCACASAAARTDAIAICGFRALPAGGERSIAAATDAVVALATLSVLRSMEFANTRRSFGFFSAATGAPDNARSIDPPFPPL